MKYVKLVVLASLAIAAAAAFIGASTATAESTLLCLLDSNLLAPSALDCDEPFQSEMLHYISVNEKEESAKGVILNELINVECNQLILAELLPGLKTNASAILHVTAANLLFTNCSPCTVTTEAGGLILILKLTSGGFFELGDVTMTGFKVKVVCLGFIKCVYNATNLVGHFLGPLVTGNTDHITYSKSSLTSESGGLCPATAFLDVLLKDLARTYIRH